MSTGKFQQVYEYVLVIFYLLADNTSTSDRKPEQFTYKFVATGM